MTRASPDPRDFVRLADCPNCRYDLTGSTSARCPECGHERDENTFALPVVSFRLGRRRRAIQIAASFGSALLGALLYVFGILSMGALALFLMLGSLAVIIGFTMWRTVRVFRGYPDAVLYFCPDGVWEQTASGRRPLPGWRRFHRFRLRRSGRKHWSLRLSKPWWHLGIARSPRLRMVFRATRREAALVRARLRRLDAAGAFRGARSGE